MPENSSEGGFGDSAVGVDGVVEGGTGGVDEVAKLPRGPNRCVLEPLGEDIEGRPVYSSDHEERV